MRITTRKRFDISLAFSAITLTSSSSFETGKPVEESNSRRSHWALIIAHHDDPESFMRIIQLVPKDGKILIGNDSIHPAALALFEPYYLVATYHGDQDDFDRVLRHHPMRGGEYSAAFNNCHHFAAIFLILLKALATEATSTGKFFVPETRYTSIVHTIIGSDGTFIWNQEHAPFRLEALSCTLPPSLFGVSAIASMAARATTTVAVPASGLRALFGAAPTLVTVAAPWAGTAAAAAGACAFGAVGAIGLSGTYFYNCHQWKEKTRIKDPSKVGFPAGEKLPLTYEEKAHTEATPL